MRKLNEISNPRGVLLSEYVAAADDAAPDVWLRAQPQSSTVARAVAALNECGDMTVLSALCKSRIDGVDVAAVERLHREVNRKAVVDVVAPSIAATRDVVAPSSVAIHKILEA